MNVLLEYLNPVTVLLEYIDRIFVNVYIVLKGSFIIYSLLCLSFEPIEYSKVCTSPTF